MKKIRLKLPTERLPLSTATLSAILPGFIRICAHVSGGKLESHLNPSSTNAILMRLRDRYVNQRFDKALAGSFCKLKDRLLAINRKLGGDLQVTLPELTMIAFAIRCGRDANVGRKSFIARLETRIENRRKKLYRRTIAEGGRKTYDAFRERWTAFRVWIRHKLAYQKQLDAKRIRKPKPSKKQTTAAGIARTGTLPFEKAQVARSAIDVEAERLIRKLANAERGLISDAQMRRAVRAVKDAARKGGFDWYDLRDLLKDEKLFEPMLRDFLIKKSVLVDLSTKQAAGAAKIRAAMQLEGHSDGPSTPLHGGPGASAKETRDKLATTAAPGTSRPTLTTGLSRVTAKSEDLAPSNFGAPTENALVSPAAKTNPAPGREELTRCTAQYMSSWGPPFRILVFNELQNMHSQFTPTRHWGDLKAPSEYFDLLRRQKNSPRGEAYGILTILSWYGLLTDAVGIMEEAWRGLA